MDSAANGKKKKALSCAECRRLKIKCERTFPCSHCVKRGLASICPDRVLANGSRRVKILSDTHELHDRIAELEDALAQATANQHRLVENAWYAHADEIGSIPGPSRTHRQSSVPIAQDSLSSFSHLRVGEDSKRSRYFGAASSFYLSKHFLDTASNTTLASSINFAGYFAPAPYRDPQQELRYIMERHLPRIDVAHVLAEAYFQTFGWYTIIVQRRAWDHDFLPHAYSNSPELNPQKLAIVFLIFALGESMDFSKPPRNEAAREYFSAARACLAIDASPSVTLVQCIFLYGSAMMNGGDETAGGDSFWPLLRIGMTIAEELGLHRDGSHWDLDERDAFERRIVFWEIHGFDVLQSIALGRGQCIADYAIDCVIPPADLEIGFHCKTFELTRIWSRINDRQIRIQPSTYTEVIEIDQALMEIQNGLPAHLSSAALPSLYDLADRDQQKGAFQRNMILLYINEARLALHRGWFARVLKEYPEEPLQSPQKQSYVDCLEACRGIILIIRNMLALHGQLIHRRWHFFFHLFSACVVLAAGAIRAPGSALARAVLAELEMGVALFRMTKRTELSTIERLRDHAVRAVERGQGQAGQQFHVVEEPNDEVEDLDLLGARKTLLRSEWRAIPHVEDQLAFGNGANDQIYNSMDFNLANIPTIVPEFTPPESSIFNMPPDFDVDEFMKQWGLYD